MTWFTALGLSVQDKAEKIVNEVIGSFTADSINECVSSAKNQFDSEILRTKLNIPGNIEAQQKARLVLACIQKSKVDTELIQKLQTEIKDRMKSEIKPEAAASLANLGVQISDKDFDQMIDNSVKIDTENICQADVSNLASLSIRDSDVNLGCTPEQISQAAATCQAAFDQVATLSKSAQDYAAKALQAKSASGEERFLQLAQQANDSADKALAAMRSPDGPCASQNECARKKSQILINQEAELEGKCNQAQEIATKLATEVDTLSRTEMDQTVTTGMSPLTWLLIIGGAVLGLLILVGAIVAIVRATRKQSPAPYGQQQMPYPMMTSPSGPAIDQYGRPLYPAGTSYDASVAGSAAPFY